MGDRRDESSGAGRVQRKKQRRGASRQQTRLQEPHTRSHRGGKSRQQSRQQQSAGPSAAFLAALEEQRENERCRQELQQHADGVTTAADQSDATNQSTQRHQSQAQRPAPIVPPVPALQPAAAAAAQRSKPAHIAGFFYDEAQKRYFKLTPQMKQHLKQSKQQRIAREKDAVRRKSMQTSRACHLPSTAVGARSALRTRWNATSGGWIGYCAERESSVAWSVGRRDQREMMPRLFASSMVPL